MSAAGTGTGGAAAAGVLLTAVAAATLIACAGARPAPPDPPAPFVVVPDRQGTVVAVAVTVPGSGWEVPGLEGLTLLAASTLLEQARPALEAVGARARVRCDPAAFVFTLVAAPDHWPTALDIFLDALFRPAPDDAALERARTRLRASLDLDRASPAWQARLGIRQALYGDGNHASAWTAPVCGLPELLDRFTLRHVTGAAYRFDATRASAAVVGPVDHRAAATLEARLRPGGLPGVDSPPHVRSSRRYIERNTVTARVAVGFPFAPDADLDAVRLLGAILVDAVTPSLERPDVFDAGYEVQRHGQGGALVVHLVTAPGAALRYGSILEAAVASAGEAGVREPVYLRVTRRHRGLRLQELAAPEDRAEALAMTRAYGMEPGAGWPGPVSRDRVRATAAAVGRPAIVVVGPRSARPEALP